MKTPVLKKVFLDPERKVIIGSKSVVAPDSRALIFLGTNISGKFHLGHVALLSLSYALADQFNSKIVVSLNEAESIYSKGNNLKEIYKNRAEISSFLSENGCLVHSRMENADLVLLATRLWKILVTDKSKSALIKKHFKKKLSADELLSLCFMAVAPIFSAHEEKSDDVLLVYGLDQISNLEFIYELYKQSWFVNEVASGLGLKTPKLNFLVIRLIPDILNRGKMSKSISDRAISFDQITEDTRLTTPIVNYLDNLIQAVAQTKSAQQNVWLSYASKLIF
jgi:tryptophanyl-tRNA synthetase